MAEKVYQSAAYADASVLRAPLRVACVRWRLPRASAHLPPEGTVVRAPSQAPASWFDPCSEQGCCNRTALSPMRAERQCCSLLE